MSYNGDYVKLAPAGFVPVTVSRQLEIQTPPPVSISGGAHWQEEVRDLEPPPPGVGSPLGPKYLKIFRRAK